MIWLAFSFVIAPYSYGQDSQADNQSKVTIDHADFYRFIDNFLAQRYGSNLPPLIKQAFAGIKPVERVLELDRRQPEFTLHFWEYIWRALDPQRVAKGREMLTRHHTLLSKVEAQYGIPKTTLVAFWGLETNYGAHLGSFEVIPSLSTLAHDPRRRAFFSQELTLLLNLLDQDRVPLSALKSSWAGAMGHLQFMPSSLYHFGRDGDGDGKINLIQSLDDAMVSAGQYLQSSGWRENELWGREITLPADFDFNQIGTQPYALRQWASWGAKNMAGNPIPPLDDMKGRLIMPAGHKGPIFIAYDNFDVILRWNRSNFYALAVGLLSDQLAGRIGLVSKAPDNFVRLDRTTIMQIQTTLANANYDVGEVDGVMGSRTKRALSLWQKDHGLVADGFADRAVIDKMGIIISE